MSAFTDATGGIAQTAPGINSIGGFATNSFGNGAGGKTAGILGGTLAASLGLGGLNALGGLGRAGLNAYDLATVQGSPLSGSQWAAALDPSPFGVLSSMLGITSTQDDIDANVTNNQAHKGLESDLQDFNEGKAPGDQGFGAYASAMGGLFGDYGSGFGSPGKDSFSLGDLGIQGFEEAPAGLYGEGSWSDPDAGQTSADPGLGFDSDPTGALADMEDEFGYTDADYGPGGASGEGDGEGGTVICTELNRQKLVPWELYQNDSAYGRRLLKTDPLVMEGYWSWGNPTAALMRKSKVFTYIMLFLAMPAIKEMAHRNKPTLFGGSLVGKAILYVGIPICRAIGAIKQREAVMPA